MSVTAAIGAGAAVASAASSVYNAFSTERNNMRNFEYWKKQQAINNQYQAAAEDRQNKYNIQAEQRQIEYNKDAEARAQKYAIEAENRANAYNEKQIHDARQYDSYASQMSRLRAAGLNPNLLNNSGANYGAPFASQNSFSTDAHTASASPVSAGYSPAGPYAATAASLPPELGVNMMLAAEQLKQMRLTTEKMRSENKGLDLQNTLAERTLNDAIASVHENLSSQQIENIGKKLANENSKIALDIAEKTKDSVIRLQQLTTDTAQINYNFLEQEHQLDIDFKQQSIAKLKSDIVNSTLDVMFKQLDLSLQKSRANFYSVVIGILENIQDSFSVDVMKDPKGAVSSFTQQVIQALRNIFVITSDHYHTDISTDTHGNQRGSRSSGW